MPAATSSRLASFSANCSPVVVHLRSDRDRRAARDRQPAAASFARTDSTNAARMLVERALQKDPAARLQTMREIVAELRQVARKAAGQSALHAAASRRSVSVWAAAAAAIALDRGNRAAVTVAAARYAAPTPTQYIPLTNFADSATSPALSPDGRMLAFIRGPSTFSVPDRSASRACLTANRYRSAMTAPIRWARSSLLTARRSRSRRGRPRQRIDGHLDRAGARRPSALDAANAEG